MPPLDQAVIAAFLVFSRVGACMMAMPGLSSPRIPLHIRLFLAVACSLMLVPLVMAQLLPATSAGPMALFRIIATEVAIGILIGILARVYFWALQFMANVIAMAIGFSGAPAGAVEEAEPQAAIASIVTFTALLLFFVTDLHLEVFRALLSSYSSIPVDGLFDPGAALIDVTDAMSGAFIGTLRIAAPFVVFAIVVNVAIGLINKLTPTIPVYFISLPFVLAGGLTLFYFLAPELLRLFTGETAAHLRSF
ncbi:MAG: flagellar biosynthetic protein FliR [Phyllobacterium sp.]